MLNFHAGFLPKGGPCLALGGAFVLERYGETRCVP